MARPAQLWRDARIWDAPGSDALVTIGDRIEWVGAETSLPVELRARCSSVHDLRAATITPGLIDAHTHLVFAGQRADEFARRRRGESYESIASQGGGILATMRATREASLEALIEASVPRLLALLDEGVTTIEIKSGYGLSLADEAKSLRAARALARRFPVTVRTTYLAAHALPPEFAQRADDYVRILSRQWLPELLEEGLVDAVDIYCDSGAFEAQHAEILFEAAQRHGLRVKMHAGQFTDIGAAKLAARFGALSCDHLEVIDDESLDAMSQAGAVAVLLPVAYYCLAQRTPPPIARLRERNIPMAVATDCNPGTAPCASLLLAMNMAAHLFGLTADEAMNGVTRHAARALGLSADIGCLTMGSLADFVIWNANSADELSYWTGFNPCRAVVRHGVVVRGQP